MSHLDSMVKWCRDRRYVHGQHFCVVQRGDRLSSYCVVAHRLNFRDNRELKHIVWSTRFEDDKNAFLSIKKT